MTEKKLRRIVQLCAVAAVVVIFAAAIILARQMTYLSELNTKKKLLEQQLANIQQQQQSLESTIAYKNSTEYIEQYAREVLGLSKEGEIQFTPKDAQ